jgi:hypothetical protein
LDYNPYRESGLPQTTGDVGGNSNRYGFEDGIVTAIYPDLWRVDIAPNGGGLVRKAFVMTPWFPPVHIDTEQPSRVLFSFVDGRVHDPFCFPYPWRRMYGPETADDGHDRHFYQKNRHIVRIGDITIRVDDNNRIYLFDAESNDICMYDLNERTMHTIVPHIFMGTDDATRYEYHRDEQVRIVIPKALIGETAVQDADGISYVAHQLVHLVSDILVKATAGAEVHLIAPLIKLTATGSIVLDPPHIYLGNAGATEPVILGNLFKAFLNVFLTLFNGHSHSNVQTGGGFSGPPTIATALMDNSTLSTIAKVSE